MKVIIELDSTDYMYIKNGCIVPIKIDNHIYDAIRSGTVLPEGHGDLIDRDYFADKYVGCGSVYCEDISCNECNSRIVSKLTVDNAPAVIPTDKECDDESSS